MLILLIQKKEPVKTSSFLLNLLNIHLLQDKYFLKIYLNTQPKLIG
ncbi:hypothetical protein D11S_2275 (plasmid) [Aggregatibacter actinomycetemcomitans D11S-1]|nr:hypothetical protein D11S_2275 [Aggregatibacter actinomycetemcomitans D11S-1]